MAVEIVDSAPPLLLKELQGKSALSASGSAASIKMKTNVDSFSHVADVLSASSIAFDNDGDDHYLLQYSSRSHSSQLTRDSTVGSSMQLATTKSASIADSKKDKGTGVMTVKKQKKKSNGTLHLNDKLSRKRSVMGSNNSGGGTTGAAHGSKLLWKYEREGSSSHPFTPEISDFHATALPSTIQLSSGVVLSQGESLVEGPTRIESPNTMSRKRFDVSFAVLMALVVDSHHCRDADNVRS